MATARAGIIVAFGAVFMACWETRSVSRVYVGRGYSPGDGGWKCVNERG